MLIFIALFKTFAITASVAQPADKELEAKIKILATKYLSNPENAGISIGIVSENNELNFSHGIKNKLTSELVDSNSIFEIGSITKIFTSLILAQEVIQGKLDLQEKISHCFPGKLISNECSEINLLQLATHSSGLPRLADNFWPAVQDRKNPYESYSEHYLLEYLTTAKPYNKIGTRYNYSNVGAGLLGYVLCQKNKSSYEKLVHELVCSPFGMNNTNVLLKSTQLNDLALGHSKGKVVKNWDFQDATAGQGALRSNIVDMNKFVKHNLDPKKSALFEAINFTQQLHFKDSSSGMKMGLGWHIGSFYNEKYLEHTGGTGGYRSFIGICPESKIGVVILSNSDNDVSALGIEILKELRKFSL
ncbi:MAG: serine hydrolase [Bacteroidota bacterium]|nr:serine hydrolase [Bacteroidota bacterium]